MRIMTQLRNKLGFSINNFGSSELAFQFIKNGNILVAEDPNVDLVGFYEDMALPCVDANFPIIPLSYAYRFEGPMILTSLNIAEKSLDMPYLTDRMFYIWDLDWIRPWKKSCWRSSYELYNNPAFRRSTRCEDYAKVIKSVCECDVDLIVEDCDLKKLSEELKIG